jgi:hypothetical protein
LDGKERMETKLDTLSKQIVQAKRHLAVGICQIGKALKEIQDGNLFLLADCKTLAKYASKEHGLGRSMTYNAIGVFEKWGELILSDTNLQAIEPTRLYKLLPHATPENAVELLHEAAMLPDVRGFENTLKVLKGRRTTDDGHTHIWKHVTITYDECEICQLKKDYLRDEIKETDDRP